VPRLLNIPNIISLSRVPMAIAFVLSHDVVVRSVLACAAAASDWLDGWWARTRGPNTRTGALLDPATDKLFVVSALIGFAVSGEITLLQLGILLARDIYVAFGAVVVLLLRLPVRLRARFPGKVLTNLQIATVLMLLLVPAAATVLVAIAGIVTIWAIIDYSIEGVRSLRRPADGG
jgi:CDP-diacylglycerol--glycerol-3-phosphate 3-phosphatidyltransferase/cardiolipin synthase